MSDTVWVGKAFLGDLNVAQTIAALMQLRPDTADRTPVDADFGRAAGLLREEGIRVLVAAPEGVQVSRDQASVTGWVPRGGRWEASGPHPLHAVYNRLPARYPGRFASVLQALQLQRVAVGNPAAVNRLALDKGDSLAALAAAGLPVPEVETHAERFAERLQSWGTAFHKPRFGSFGRGVARIVAGAPVPSSTDGDGPAILQRAVAPPAGPYGGVCVRGLVQREVHGRWRVAGRVARVSHEDPVVNVARGADALPVARLADEIDGLDDLEVRLDRLEMRVVRSIERLAGEEAAAILEVGVDWVLDPQGEPWLIEINGKPGGRLRVLAGLEGEDGEIWRERHAAALAAPFRRLAAT